MFLVDWSQVANTYSYSSCIANLPVLGDSLAYFIERLLTRFQIEPKNLHLISHSLGCHLAAYTGQRLIAEGLKIGNQDLANFIWISNLTFHCLSIQDI